MWMTVSEFAKHAGVSMTEARIRIYYAEIDAYKIGDVWRVWLNDDKFFADRNNVDMPLSLVETIERDLDPVIRINDLAKFLKMKNNFFYNKRHIYAIPIQFIEMDKHPKPRLAMYRDDLILWLNSVSNLNIDEDAI